MIKKKLILPPNFFHKLKLSLTASFLLKNIRQNHKKHLLLAQQYAFFCTQGLIRLEVKGLSQKTIKFREAALAHTANIDDLDQLIRITPPRRWIMLAVLWIILISLILWSIFGYIPTYASGQGILISHNSSIYDATAPLGISQVEKLAIRIGDHVNKGTIIAYLGRSDLIKQITVTQAYLQQLQIKHRQLSQISQQEIAQRNEQLQQENNTLQNMLHDQTENLQHAQELLNTKLQAYQKGIITKQDIAISQRDYYAIKLTLEQTRKQLIASQTAVTNFIDDWRQRLQQLELTIIDKQHELASLQGQLQITSTAVSPATGVVTAIHTAVGDTLQAGSPIASITPTYHQLDALIFFPVKEGQQVKSKMTALLTPNTIKKEEFGSILGKVIGIDSFPSTDQSMLALLHNDGLVREFTKQGPLIMARALLQKDPTTYSGYKWSSSAGPEQQITPGIIISAQVMVRKQAPITLIIPSLKKLLMVQ